MSVTPDSPLTYTGTNASNFLDELRKLGWTLDGDFPSAAHSSFYIRKADTTGPTHRIDEGDSVWPGLSGYGLTLDKTPSTQRKMRDAACAEPVVDYEARRSALQRILRLGSSGGRHARSQLIADLNAVGVGDDEITEALRVAWLTYGES